MPEQEKKEKKRPSVRNAAMDYLSRREHSALELQQKLTRRGFESDEINLAIERLQQDNLQSDDRFIENYVRHKVNSGQGPFKIRHELKSRGVDLEQVDVELSAYEDEWHLMMSDIRERKFGGEIPQDRNLISKQVRFLQNRGFSAQAVMRLFR